MKQPPKKRVLSDAAMKQIQAAQLTLVEKALVGFTEEVDGRISSDEEILSEGMHVVFDENVLTTYGRDGISFVTYYVWRRTNAIALAFDKADPLLLHAVRLEDHEWPTALKLYCKAKFAEKDGA
jgi:hypothetical protein